MIPGRARPQKSFPGRLLFRSPTAVAALLLAAAVLAMFADVLVTGTGKVVSAPGTDTQLQFCYWRQFGTRQMRSANFPLWNPHVFSGVSFVGNFQSALFYPPNLVFLLLPTTTAVNITVVLHVFLAGLFMYLWAAHRRMRFAAALLCGILLMFSGAFFLHVYAGHLVTLCAMAWAPLLFLCVDGISEETDRWGWILLGALALAMQIFSGHPQYAYNTALAALVHGVFVMRGPRRWKKAAALATMLAGGMALTCVQLLPGLEAARESVRGAGFPYGLAAMFSFSPENLLTVWVPGFFGDMKTVPYWGRWYPWEMSLFVGVCGFLLAVCGATGGERATRKVSLWMIGILLVLALGRHTPLFWILYHWLPGFGSFRGASKFLFQTTLFIILLAGSGMDSLLRGIEKQRWRTAVAAAILCILLGSAALLVRGGSGSPRGWWRGIPGRVSETGESFLRRDIYQDASFPERAGAAAARSLAVASGTAFLFLAGLLLARRNSRAIHGVLLLAAVEVFAFGRAGRATFPSDSLRHADLKRFLATDPGDHRILNLVHPNAAIALDACDIWGYDPLVSRRYAEFMSATQGLDPDHAGMYVPFSCVHPLYRMLRLRYVFFEEGGRLHVERRDDAMPRLLLIQRYLVARGRDAVFRALAQPGFDPCSTVVLEEVPEPVPGSSIQAGSVRLVSSSTDHLVIEADLPSAAILLVTDAYSRSWRARALPGSCQGRYRVLPADYVLRAIPLSAGRHRLKIEYLPKGFVVGKWISLVLAAAYAGAVLFRIRRRFRSACRGEPPGSRPNGFFPEVPGHSPPVSSGPG